jgi:hypothetical protein
MSVAINISLLPKSKAVMDSVNLLLEAAGRQWNLTFSRVPIAGEHILIKGAGRYIVRDVTHTPHNTYTAKLEIELIQPEV